MSGSHSVVGIDGLIQLIVFLIANYFIIYLIVSHSVKKGMQRELNDLQSELKDIREQLQKKEQ
ncbi:hypothetical protein [Paenibacillus dokdonensis]|uniref:hypothetical protein n=1 Tax=Paenibacillus dokdonensis TaxID=2567944 RepID=UPI0010A84D90|nr:hypothetical protein [Paenibacillus dokdonensis]